MNTLRIVLLAMAAMALWGATAFADDIEPQIPPGNYPRHMGSARLNDPSGAAHSKVEVENKVVVVIFSVPSLSQGDRQQTWADLLANNPKTKVSDVVSLVLIEDMSQAGMFKDEARARMKKEFAPGSRPLLILDETGATLKRYGIPRNKTEIFIYDKTGTLRDVESNLDDQTHTLRRIKVLTRRFLAE